MLDFSAVKGITLPEGGVKALSIGGVEVWKQGGEPEPGYLRFTAKQAGSTVSMTAAGSAPAVSLEYSSNGGAWTPFVVGSTVITLSDVGDYVELRGENSQMSSSASNVNTFSLSGEIAASGNVMSLLGYDPIPTDISSTYAFCCLFRDCTSLVSAPALPATTLANYCYDAMFRGCTSLVSAPALPATTLANHCYERMFRDCTSLVVYNASGVGHSVAWGIPDSGSASSYKSQSYMFYGCPGSYRSSTSVALNQTFYTQNPIVR